MRYQAHTGQYDNVKPEWYRRCGESGLLLPAVSLGCWHNFGGALEGWNEDVWHEHCRQMLFTAFDLGITHIDLANNYGPPPGSAEERVGQILHDDLSSYRDELIITTKAGYRMQPGPYGDGGGRKYLLASLDASLRRLKLDYVDIYYHHRPDKHTPLDESLAALDQAVRSGKAIYAGISNYRGELTRKAVEVCRTAGLSLPVVNQSAYSMLNRGVETDLLPAIKQTQMGLVVFSPLAQGQLTDRYLNGIPKDSRAGAGSVFLKPDNISDASRRRISRLNEMARQRGQTLAQMALGWVLRFPSVTTVLIGASKPEQIKDNVRAAEASSFTEAELREIDAILAA